MKRATLALGVAAFCLAAAGCGAGPQVAQPTAFASQADAGALSDTTTAGVDDAAADGAASGIDGAGAATAADLPRANGIRPDRIVIADSRPPQYATVTVHYGTNRLPTGERTPNSFFGTHRGPLQYGVTQVSVPFSHEIGVLEAPKLWKFEVNEDPRKHMVLMTLTPLSSAEFAGQLTRRIGAASLREVFVFVHGYKVAFKDAVRRTAQIAYDMNYRGVPLLFSWPSQGSLGGYRQDEASVTASVPDLQQFLQVVASQGADRVHLMAHSMGNRVLAAALVGLAGMRRPDGKPLFREVILAAPDIDRAVFLQEILPAMRPATERLTLYASNSDQALKASRRLNSSARLGQADAGMALHPDLCTVDATHVDTSLLGHSFYAQSRSILRDIARILVGSPPQDAGLVRLLRGGREFWRAPGD